MKKISFLLPLLALNACATLPATDHRHWMAVSCSGFKGWDACNQKAMEACPQGYDSANLKEDLTAQLRSMEYACKQ